MNIHQSKSILNFSWVCDSYSKYLFSRLSDYILSLNDDHKPGASQHEAKMLAMVDEWKTKLVLRTSDLDAPPKPTDARVIVRYHVISLAGPPRFN